MPANETQPGLGRLQLQLPPDPGAPAAARRALRTLPLGTRADDVLLVASELVNNAVQHADSDDPIELVAECRPDGAWVEVTDHGDRFDTPPIGAGHGLQILTAASQRWGIVHDGCTTVWFEIR